MANASTRTARKTTTAKPAEKPAATPANAVAVRDFNSAVIEFTPLGESASIKLTANIVRNTLAVRSRSGREPTDADITKFMMLCRSRALNPFVGDAYLVGYDNSDGRTTFNLITAAQALRKRAEINDQYDGTVHGIIVRCDGKVERREGTFLDDGETLLGGWAIVYRKDRTHPASANVKLSTYNTGKSRWAKDAAGMISKVAEAAALREAFPSDVGCMYLQAEFDDGGSLAGDGSQVVEAGTAPRQLGDLTDQLRANAQAEIDAQDQMAVDQSGPEDDGAQAPPVDDGEPQMSAEEIADHERERAEHEGRSDHGGKAGGLFEKGEQYR